MAEGTHDHQPSDDTTTPIPPRFRALKRTALGVGLALVGLLGLRLAWGCEAQRRLQAKIDQYHAAGEPILLADFDRAPIPEADNAARCYKAAIEALVETKGEPVDYLGYSPQLNIWFLDSDVIAGNMDTVGRLFAANAEALRLTRVGRQRAACDWEIQLHSPLTALYPLVNEQRQLPRLTAHAAEYEHLRGDDAEAVELLLDTLVFTDRIHDPRGFFINYHVAQGATALVLSRIERIAPSLTIADATSRPSASASPASRSQVAGLIAELLDESEQRAGWADAWLGVQVHILDSVDVLCTGRRAIRPSAAAPVATPDLWELPVRLALGPLWRLDAIRLLDFATETRVAALAPNWPQAAALLPEFRYVRKGLRRHLHYPELAMSDFPPESPADYSRVFESHYRSLARRRMAALALAIRLYELDRGHRPATLSDLVPDYVPDVPADPFTADNQPLRYLPDAEQPRLYSVGFNGVDDGGYRVMIVRTAGWSVTSGGRTPTASFDDVFEMQMRVVDWEQGDIPFMLDGQPPPERDAGQATTNPASISR